MSRALGLEPKVVRVSSAKASRQLPTPYGVFSILYDGKLIADRPVSARRFSHIMSKIAEAARKVTGRTPPFIGTMMRSVRSRER